MFCRALLWFCGDPHCHHGDVVTKIVGAMLNGCLQVENGKNKHTNTQKKHAYKHYENKMDNLFNKQI